MTDEQGIPEEEGAPLGGGASPEAGGTAEGGAQSPADAWKEVGAQFQALGAGLATAFKTAWADEENKRHMKEMQAGLESMVNELGAAIKAGATSPEAKQVKEEAGKTLGTFRAAGEKTVQEVRPTLITALHQLNDQVQKLLGRMKQNEGAASGPEDGTTAPSGDSAPKAP
jgi:uncharacterized protein (DUF2342 family)